MSYQIENYSEKAIAIFGDTEGIKDQLIELGGKFNPHLRGRPGWIFPKSKESSLMKTPIFANAKPREAQADDDAEDEVVVPQKRLLKPNSQSVETMLLDIIQRLKRIEERLN
jgi:hypothetical protein